jgi:hypothetical protein
MAHELLHERLFSNADAETVVELYASFFRAVSRAHTHLHLNFGHLRWCAEGAQLALVAPRLLGLTRLSLEDNALGESSAVAALSHALAHCPSLTDLSLDRNGLGCEGATELARALRGDLHGRPAHQSALRSLSLSHRGSYPQIGPHGAYELGLLLASRRSGLTRLDLSDNRLCGVDFLGSGRYDSRGLFAISLALRSGHSSLAHLNLAGNELCAVPRMRTATSGIAAVVAALLSGGGALTELDLTRNNLSAKEHAAANAAAANVAVGVHLGDPLFLVSSEGKYTGNFFRGSDSTRNLLENVDLRLPPITSYIA